MGESHWYDGVNGNRGGPWPSAQLSIRTPLSPEGAIAAINEGISAKRYWDPGRHEAAFLRLHGRVTGPAFVLTARSYLLPGIPGNGLELDVRGMVQASGGGSVVSVVVTNGGPSYGGLPVIGKYVGESEASRLAVEAEGVRGLLVGMVGIAP
jgi:hypothetical protein